MGKMNRNPKRHAPVLARSLDTIRANLSAYSREPFIDVLTMFLNCAPDAKSIKTFAQQYPDRWANALRALGQLAGFREQIDIENNVFVAIHSMSDAQLMEHLTRLKPVIEGIALEAPAPRSAQNSGISGEAMGVSEEAQIEKKE